MGIREKKKGCRIVNAHIHAATAARAGTGDVAERPLRERGPGTGDQGSATGDQGSATGIHLERTLNSYPVSIYFPAFR